MDGLVVLWEPEPDFFAGAGAGKNEPSLGCCYVTYGI